jgi:hypothetical protein
MMEYWNDGILGMKSGKKYLFHQKNVISAFYDDALQTSIFCFRTKITPLLRKNQYKYIRFDTLNSPFQYSLRAGGQNP